MLGELDPIREETKHLNGSEDDIAKAKYEINIWIKKKKNLTNFKEFGGIKLLASRKQTHFSGSCPEGVFNS